MSNANGLSTTHRFATASMLRKSLAIWIAVLIVGNAGATGFAQLNHGHGILDFAGYANLFVMRTPWLSPQESYQHLSGYTELGRHLYYYILGIDFLIPLSGGFFFFCAFRRFMATGKVALAQYRVLRVLPIAFVLADHLENVFILLMLAGLPERTPVFSYLTTTFLTLKFAFGMLSCSVIVVLTLTNGKVDRITSWK